MKKYLLIVLSIIYAFQLSAQADAFNFKLSTKGHRKVIPVIHANGTSHYVFINKTDLEIHWFDINQSRTLIVPLEKQFKKAKILTTTTTNDSLFVFFWDSNSKKIEALAINKTSKNYIFKEIIAVNTNEEFFKSIRDNENLYILTLNSANVLKVVSLHGSAIIASNDYEIPFSVFYKTLEENSKNLIQPTYSQVGITQISHDVANNLRSTLPFEKMYFINNIIYFTFDEATTTHLFRIHLSEKKCDYKKMNFKLERLSSISKGNSFLIGNRFLRITANQLQANICIVDLDSFKLIKNYNLYPEIESFDIQNSPITIENNDVSEPDFLTPRTFFKNIMEGDVAIAANVINKDNYELIIGSEEEIITQRSNFGPSLMGGNTPLSFGIGIGTSSGTSTGLPYNNTTSFTLTTSFKSILNSTNFTHMSGKTSKNLIVKLREFEDRIFGGNIPEIITIYKNQDKTQYGFIGKRNNTFYVVEF